MYDNKIMNNSEIPNVIGTVKEENIISLIILYSESSKQ